VPGLFGRVFTPVELARAWQLSENSSPRLFQDQEGVFTLGNPKPRGQCGYTMLRIPEAVVLRVWKAREGLVVAPGHTSRGGAEWPAICLPEINCDEDFRRTVLLLGLDRLPLIYRNSPLD
jgi:hypothetical protein